MAQSTDEFLEYVLEDVLGGIEGITSKRMFGGYNLYLEGVIFAIIVSDELYFKVDDTNKADYVTVGSRPFVYDGYKDRGPMTMPYWTVPEEIMSDREMVYDWVMTSAEISKKTKK